MFNKYIIHLKNIIFFKIIIYVLAIILLLSILFIVSGNLTKSIEQNNKAKNNFSQATIKLYSIVNAGSKILDAYNQYEEILDRSSDDNCLITKKIFSQVKDLAIKYNLADTLELSATYPKVDSKITANQIVINNYDLKIRFKAQNFPVFLQFIKDTYNIMPIGSAIMSYQANRREFIDSSSVKTLSEHTVQKFIYSYLHIRIRELSLLTNTDNK